MKRMKKQDGFTMVELLVTIVSASLVTFAAASLLLFGTRMQYAATGDTSEQQTVRIVLTLLEGVAGSGKIREVHTDYNGWELRDESGEAIFRYLAAEQTLYSGAAPILTELSGAGIWLDEKNLLHFSFDTQQGESYETCVYCRTNITEESIQAAEIGGLIGNADNNALRLRFLNTLAAEYADGKNTGVIQAGAGAERYYSEWYIGSEHFGGAWNARTPWCACFLSWAAVESGLIAAEEKDRSPYIFANVDAGIAAFRDAGKLKEEEPLPGDYVFFDWTGGKDPSHVGAVLNVTNQYIYTLEGNSGGVVAVRCYEKDSSVIIGYGEFPFF